MLCAFKSQSKRSSYPCWTSGKDTQQRYDHRCKGPNKAEPRSVKRKKILEQLRPKTENGEKNLQREERQRATQITAMTPSPELPNSREKQCDMYVEY